MEYLPNLQSLILSQLPFFDHGSLVALGSPGNYAGQSYADTQAVYDLRLLRADREPNTTSFGLAQALVHFPKLIYLDLSYTTPARDPTVLSRLSRLPDLQVLKLRGIGLRDSGAEILAHSIRRRVRLLDLRHNMLTDIALRCLIQECFLPADVSTDPLYQAYRSTESEWARLVGSLPDFFVPDSLRSQFLDDHLLWHLTRPFNGRSIMEDLPHVGITHLYVSENNISVEGLGSLLSTKRLHVLDGGTVDTADAIKKRNERAPGGDSQFVTTMRFPGAEKLIPILKSEMTQDLTYLRVHHAAITENPSEKELSMADLLPELPSNDPDQETQDVELDASGAQISELPAEVHSIYELPDTSISITPAAQELPAEEINAHRLDPGDMEPVLNATGSGLSASSPVSPLGLLSPVSHIVREHVGSDLPEPVSPLTPSPVQPRDEQIQQFLAKRPRPSRLPQRTGGLRDYSFLHPCNISHIRTLILTDIPSSVPASSSVIPSLTRFISACADESFLASLQAQSDYSLPPGWQRLNAEQQHAKRLFSLECIELEITPVAKPARLKKLTPWTPHSYQNPGASKSSTGDMDSENLWAAAMNDFSFFGEDECGIPESEGQKNFPTPLLDEKVVLSPADDEPQQQQQHSLHARDSTRSRPISGSHLTTQPPSRAGTPSIKSPVGSVSPQQQQQQQQHHQRPVEATPAPEPELDVVQELAAFRRAKRTAYNDLLQKERMQRFSSGGPEARRPSAVPPFVEGYWKGQVKIVRNPVPTQKSGMVDLYGNYFEKGYLYP